MSLLHTHLVSFLVDARKAVVAFVVPLVVVFAAQRLDVEISPSMVEALVYSVIQAGLVYIVRNGPKPVADVAQDVIDGGEG